MVFIICIHVHLKSSWALHHRGVRYRHAVSVLCNANTSPLKCINVCRHIKLKITDTSRLHPGHAHTTSHNPLSLFNIKDCGSSSKQMPWQVSLFLCLRFPCDRWRGETQQSLSFFSSSKNSTIVICFFFCCFFLLQTSQWSIQKQPCECILLFNKKERFLCCCSRDWTHLDELFPPFKGFYWITTNWFLVLSKHFDRSCSGNLIVKSSTFLVQSESAAVTPVTSLFLLPLGQLFFYFAPG